MMIVDRPKLPDPAERERTVSESAERFGRMSPRLWGAIGVGKLAFAYAALDSGRSVVGTRVGRPQGSVLPVRREFLGISNWPGTPEAVPARKVATG
jgi:hypothetical protein